ncbi:MAG: hypothetical protein FRX48_02940 [Lasallia pustulata]|uniref:Uncharacterized protein n=1 Tax=Lasallia pustulata TaxID=136370 RepID=A0A5M8PUX4_9LECA|nr:MAG: hypothetical protein FRX48_02940 [Lasallia pustulata]
MQTRLMLSPLRQYSAEDGRHTAWHMTHPGPGYQAPFARMFQNLVWSFAEELGVQINMANQIPLGFTGRPGALRGRNKEIAGSWEAQTDISFVLLCQLLLYRSDGK